MAPGADAITNALPPLIWTNYFVPHKTLKTLALFIIAVPGPSGAPVLIIALQSLYSKACLQRLQVLGRGCSLSRRSGKKGGGADRGEFCQVGMFWWQRYLVLSPTVETLRSSSSVLGNPGPVRRTRARPLSLPWHSNPSLFCLCCLLNLVFPKVFFYPLISSVKRLCHQMRPDLFSAGRDSVPTSLLRLENSCK